MCRERPPPIWPPAGITTFDPFHLPFLNTMILLLSGHHDHLGASQPAGERPAWPADGARPHHPAGDGFTTCQAIEYSDAPFKFAGGGVYPSVFFLATGFHGFHVIVGTMLPDRVLVPRPRRPVHAAAAFRLRGGGLVLALRRRGLAVPVRLHLLVGCVRYGQRPAGEVASRARALTGRARLRPLLWPGLMTLIMLAALLGLGVWQVRRLAWKTALLERIDAAEAAPAVPLTSEPSPFAKVRVQGRYINGARALYGVEVRDTGEGPRMGADLLMPLQPAGGGRPVLVDRGWVPQTREQAIPLPNGTVTVEGYVRPAQRPGLFTPARRSRRPPLLHARPGGDRRRHWGCGPRAVHAGGARRASGGRVYPEPAPAPAATAATTICRTRSPGSASPAALVVIFVAYARKVLRP